MVLTDPDVREAYEHEEVVHRPPLPAELLERPKPTLRKRLREVISLCLWIAIAVPGAVLGRRRRIRRRPARARVRVRVSGRPDHLVTHVVALGLAALVLLPHLAGTALQLAARPVTASLPSRGWRVLEQPSAVVDAAGKTLARVHDGIIRRVVPLADVPDVVRNAVLAAEDQRFWGHGGFDARAVGRALKANVEARGMAQGGSTAHPAAGQAELRG